MLSKPRVCALYECVSFSRREFYQIVVHIFIILKCFFRLSRVIVFPNTLYWGREKKNNTHHKKKCHYTVDSLQYTTTDSDNIIARRRTNYFWQQNGFL